MTLHFSFLYPCSPLFQKHAAYSPLRNIDEVGLTCILLSGSAPQAKSKHIWTEELPVLIMVSSKMDPSLNCASIHKFRGRAVILTAHPMHARETVRLLLIPYRTQPAKLKGSLQSVQQTVQQLPNRTRNVRGKGRADRPFWAGNWTDKPKAGGVVWAGFFVVIVVGFFSF